MVSPLNAHDDPQTVEFMGCQVEVAEPRFTARRGVVYRDGKPITHDVARSILAVLANDGWSGAPALSQELNTALANADHQRKVGTR